MTWTYRQTTGELRGPAGMIVGVGYSGNRAGLNNPAMEADPDVGPIPAGLYHIGPALNPPDHLGPIAMPLTPVGHDAHGRSGFFCHGDNAARNHTASHGCVIQDHEPRAAIDQSADCDLLVIP